MNLNGNDEEKEEENSWVGSRRGFLGVQCWLHRERE